MDLFWRTVELEARGARPRQSRSPRGVTEGGEPRDAGSYCWHKLRALSVLEELKIRIRLTLHSLFTKRTTQNKCDDVAMHKTFFHRFLSISMKFHLRARRLQISRPAPQTQHLP